MAKFDVQVTAKVVQWIQVDAESRDAAEQVVWQMIEDGKVSHPELPDPSDWEEWNGPDPFDVYAEEAEEE